MAGPAFGEGGGRKQTVSGVGDWRLPIADLGVAHKRFDVLGAWGEARQREGEAAEEAARVGVGAGGEVVRLHLREEEAVNGVLAPGGVRWGGDGGLRERLEAPPLTAEGEGVGPGGLAGRGGRSGRANARVGRALANPFGEVREDAGVELCAVLGHLECRVRVAESLEQQAGVGLAGDDGRAGRAAFEQAVAGVEDEAGLFLRGGVALVTLGGEHGADVLLEELDLSRRGRGGVG